MTKAPLKYTSVAGAALAELKSRPFRIVLIDRAGLKRKVWRACQLWAAAVTLAEKLRGLPETRIGIVFPPAAPSWIANLAITLAGKSSVNLNFVASRDSSLRALEISGVKTVISAEVLVPKFKEFPWEKVELLDLGKFFAPQKLKVLQHLLEALLLPQFALKKIWKVPTPNLGDEATLLFSSGSTGSPKGIPLSNENILTNLHQIDEIDFLPPKIRLLCVLPNFHSMGFTVQYAYSIAYPIRAISYPTPLEPTALGQIAREEKADIIIGTASLYRLYLRSVDPKDFRSFKSVVAGAEKTPRGLPEAWQERFGSRYYEGYGLTETSPVISVCLTHAYKSGSVGKPLPYLETRIVDPETREVITTPGKRGVLEVRGPSIFSGYLDEPRLNAEMIRDGWFYTADLASLDEDGFLFIEGRLRRFSKIAGEMIPHAGVEEALVKALAWSQEEAAALVVTGRPDEKKGESLVVVCERDINLEALRAPLQAQGLPNLWIPKDLIRVESIPHLPTGKLDLCAVGKIVEAHRDELA